MEYLGIDPSTSRMLSERSTIWASTPYYFNKPFIYYVLKADFPISGSHL